MIRTGLGVLGLSAVIVAASVPRGDASLLRLLPATLVAGHERGEYVARDARTGEELWRTRWTVDQVQSDGRRLVHVREDGTGRRGRPEPTRWTVSMEVDLTTGRESFSSTREVRDASDHPLETQRRTIAYSAGTGSVRTIDHTRHAEQSANFAVDDDAIPSELLATQLRALPDLPERRMRFQLITREGKVVPMSARIVGEERVTTPAGTFVCHKVELSISGMRGAIGQFVLPAMHMWHRVEPPHVWVKYQGPDGGVGSREVSMELVMFDSRERNTR